MPYFLYRVFPGKKFERVGQFEVYRQARDSARERRKELTPEDNYSIKLVFAKDPELALAPPQSNSCRSDTSEWDTGRFNKLLNKERRASSRN